MEERLAACVSVINNVQSTYHWQGKVRTDNETLLVIKTVADKIEQANLVAKQLSGYELPEFVALEISGGSQPYLDWLVAETEG